MILKISQQLPLLVAFTDAKNNPAAVDGVPAWALTDPSLGSLATSADGLSATFSPSGQVGELKVQVTADADLGEGVKSILGELPLTLVGGDAVNVAISAGTPIDTPFIQ